MDLDKMKALALAATPGPWSAIEWTCAAPTTVRAGAVGITVADTTGHGRNSEVCAIDAAFIAAANPATVLELIAEVERLRVESANLQYAFDQIKGTAPAAGTEKDAERYQLMRASLSNGDLDYFALEGEPQEFIDDYCDAEIEAHSKASK